MNMACLACTATTTSMRAGPTSASKTSITSTKKPVQLEATTRWSSQISRQTPHTGCGAKSTISCLPHSSNLLLLDYREPTRTPAPLSVSQQATLPSYPPGRSGTYTCPTPTTTGGRSSAPTAPTPGPPAAPRCGPRRSARKSNTWAAVTSAGSSDHRESAFRPTPPPAVCSAGTGPPQLLIPIHQPTARPARAVGTQHVGGRDGRKLQRVFSTETRCGPLAADPSRIRLHHPLSPVNNSIIGKPAGQGGDAHVNLWVGYHAASPRPV